MGVTDIETVQEYVENSYGDETCRAAALESISRVSVQIKNITAQVAELGKSLKLVQSHAKRAMDQLPERWNMGFQAGLKQAIPYEQQLIEALAEEKQARLDDNAKLTADNMVVEAENQRLQDEVNRLKGKLTTAKAPCAACKELMVEENQRLQEENEKLKLAVVPRLLPEWSQWIDEHDTNTKQETAREILIHILSNEYTHEGSVLCKWFSKEYGLEG